MSTPDECAICLQAIDLRGGIPIAIPGCCGNMFHQHCINKVAAGGGDHCCPLCRHPLPAALIQNVAGNPAALTLSPAHFPAARVGASRSPSTRTADISQYPDDPIVLVAPRTAATTTAAPAAATVTATTAQATSAPLLAISHVNEFDSIPVSSVSKFYSSVGLKFLEPTATAAGNTRSPIDVVCVLDTSGSMSGVKLRELKKAMKFVIGTLNEFDRLAIVDFNSNATIIQGFNRMTDANKHKSDSNIDDINADGGTDIHSGLDLGRKLQADYVITGDLDFYSDQYHINIRLSRTTDMSMVGALDLENKTLNQLNFVTNQVLKGFPASDEFSFTVDNHYFRRTESRVVVVAHSKAISTRIVNGQNIAFPHFGNFAVVAQSIGFADVTDHGIQARQSIGVAHIFNAVISIVKHGANEVILAAINPNKNSAGGLFYDIGFHQ